MGFWTFKAQINCRSCFPTCLQTFPAGQRYDGRMDKRMVYCNDDTNDNDSDNDKHDNDNDNDKDNQDNDDDNFQPPRFLQFGSSCCRPAETFGFLS